MALPIITRGMRRRAILATFWIPVAAWRRAMRGIFQLGLRQYRHVIRTDKNRRFAHTLAVAAIMKNEGPYLKEWLDFHILVGVDKFYLYDNGSDDDTKKILAPYIRRGLVEYTWWPGRQMQNAAYVDAINRHAQDARWMALIDLDEFIVPVYHKTVPEFLYSLPYGFAQLIMTWVIYGSSGHVTKPDGLVIENYKRHSAKSWGVKSIINPRLAVRQHSAHANEVAGFTVDENGRRLGHIDQTNNPPTWHRIRCNHYITKSQAEFRARCARSDSGRGANPEWIKTLTQRFAQSDCNDVYDDIMDPFVGALKRK
ncbi:MAG: glycosyltransferase family 92 protein [Alphaproteobacteria bacterium]|nr:glycosyltransferase family 92 protein [Alphaproteobacteria bacterium]